jgi:SAM-dependent methyltransferase
MTEDDPAATATQEARRIRDVYARHQERWQQTKYRGWMPGNLFTEQEREREMLDLLRRHGRLPLTDQRILDVGCAAGKTLLTLLRFGARPQNLFGIDLLEHEIAEACTIAPHMNFQVADAQCLPFHSGSFDLVLSFAVFSSIQNPAIRKLVADEMRRVLRPGGAVLVYDFWVTGWANRDTRPIRLREIHRLFPNAEIDARRMTLAPPLARRLGRWRLTCELLGRVPVLRTHWLALVRPHTGHTRART